jgi:hypothetical protein
MTELETLISKAATHIAQIAIETLNEGEGKFLGIFDKRLSKKTEEAIAAASTIYTQQYFQRYGTVHLFGISPGVPLDSIYTEVSVWVSPEPELLDIVQNPSNEKKLPIQSGANSRGTSIKDRQELGSDTVDENRYLVVFGEPGSGKSTFLRKIGLDILKGQKLNKFVPRTYFPVLIDCQTLPGRKLQIEENLVDLFRAYSFPLAEKLTKKALEQGQLLILLDGVDRLDNESRQETIAHIETVIQQYPKNHFIVSDRISAPKAWQKLMPVGLAKFNPQQISQHIDRWYRAASSSQQTEAFQSALQQPEHETAHKLAQVPLFLNWLCFTYYHRQMIPENPSSLYQQTIDIFLEATAPHLNITEIKSWLSQIAYQSLMKENFCFSRSELISQLTPDVIKSAKAQTAEEILQAIATDRGILSSINDHQFTFAHGNLQDFFTALYILEHQLIPTTVKTSFTSWRWQQVFLFLAGLRTPNADKLLLLIEAAGLESLNRDQDINQTSHPDGNKLKSLLHWAAQVTDASSDTIIVAAKRTAALFTVFALDQVFNHKNLLMNELDLTLHNDPLLTHSLKLTKRLGLNLTEIIQNTRLLTNDLRQNLTFALSQPLDIDKLSRNLTRNLARKLAQDRARYLSLSFDRVLTSHPEMSLDRARDLAFLSILAQQLQTIPVFADLSPVIAGLESLQSEIPSNNDSVEVHTQFRQVLWETWLNNLKLDPNLLALSSEERQSLSNYFSGCDLLVKCRESALHITPATWEMISGRMLQPRE